MRATKALMLSMLAALGFAGCNPSSFNSVLDKAPVVSFTPPGSSTGSMFVLPLAAPTEAGTTSAARMLVSRKDKNYLAVADFDMNGKVKLHEASSTDFKNLGDSPVLSAAARADGMILVGTPRYQGGNPPPGRVSLVSLTPAADGSFSFGIQGGITGGSDKPHVGISVAAGNVTGLATGNFVVVGDNTVWVLGADGTTPLASTSCAAIQLASATDPYAFRPVVVGDLLGGGLDEIVLSGQVSGQGRVVFVQWWDGTSTLACSTTYLALGAVANFGASLAVGDFDGDSLQDLAVGTPPDKVYVYFGPLDTVTSPSVIITSATPTGFGQRIASYHLPGQATAQLLVADPSATVGDRAGAGTVSLFSLVGLNVKGVTTELPSARAIVTLFDSNTDSDPGVFGSNLGGLTFNTGLCVPGGAFQLVPWASNNIDVLTFFAYPNGPKDPRCFALKP